MKKNGIHVYNKKDSVLNTPGQFFFQIKEDGEYKSNNVHISRKIFNEIKIKIITSFKNISQNLKLLINKFAAGIENDKIKYYTEITNKLDKFVDLSYNRGFNFPGLQVISLTSKQTDVFAQLKERVLICEKSDGVRYLLIHFANGKCVMLGRSLEFFLVDFTTKLPIFKNAIINTNNMGNTSNEWEIISILDGELILDEIEYIKNLKESFNEKMKINERKSFPKRSESDKIFGESIDDEIMNNNFNDNNFYDNTSKIHLIDNSNAYFNFDIEKKKLEELENIYLGNLTVQQKSTMIYINEELYKVKFVVFDAIILDNVNIGHLPFHKRIESLSVYFKNLNWPQIHENLKNNFVKTFLNKIDSSFGSLIENFLHSNNNTNREKYSNAYSELNLKFKIEIFLKDYFTFDRIKFLYTKICPKLLHENDGIILNLDDYPYYSGQATEIFKWKPQELNTVDFEVEPKRFHKRVSFNKADDRENFEEILLLKVAESKDKQKVINILLFENKNEEQKFLTELRLLKGSNSKAVIECHFEKNEKVLDESFHKYEVLKRNEFEYIQDMHDHTTQFGKSYKNGFWKFMRFRKDKLHGNSLHTFYKVWESIEDDLTIDKMNQRINFL